MVVPSQSGRDVSSVTPVGMLDAWFVEPAIRGDRLHRQTRLWLLTRSASSLLEVRHSARLGDEQQVEDTLFRSHLAYLDAFLWKNSAKLDWASVQKGVAGTLAAFGNIRFQTQRRDTRSMTSSATMPMATPTNTSLVKWALRGI